MTEPTVAECLLDGDPVRAARAFATAHGLAVPPEAPRAAAVDSDAVRELADAVREERPEDAQWWARAAELWLALRMAATAVSCTLRARHLLNQGTRAAPGLVRRLSETDAAARSALPAVGAPAEDPTGPAEPEGAYAKYERLLDQRARDRFVLDADVKRRWHREGRYWLIVEDLLAEAALRPLEHWLYIDTEDLVRCGRALHALGDRVSAYACFSLVVSVHGEPTTEFGDDNPGDPHVRYAHTYLNRSPGLADRLGEPAPSGHHVRGSALAEWLEREGLQEELLAGPHVRNLCAGPMRGRHRTLRRQLEGIARRNRWFLPLTDPMASVPDLPDTAAPVTAAPPRASLRGGVRALRGQTRAGAGTAPGHTRPAPEDLPPHPPKSPPPNLSETLSEDLPPHPPKSPPPNLSETLSEDLPPHPPKSPPPDLPETLSEDLPPHPPKTPPPDLSETLPQHPPKTPPPNLPETLRPDLRETLPLDRPETLLPELREAPARLLPAPPDPALLRTVVGLGPDGGDQVLEITPGSPALLLGSAGDPQLTGHLAAELVAAGIPVLWARLPGPEDPAQGVTDSWHRLADGGYWGRRAHSWTTEIKNPGTRAAVLDRLIAGAGPCPDPAGDDCLSGLLDAVCYDEGADELSEGGSQTLRRLAARVVEARARISYSGPDALRRTALLLERTTRAAESLREAISMSWEEPRRPAPTAPRAVLLELPKDDPTAAAVALALVTGSLIRTAEAVRGGDSAPAAATDVWPEGLDLVIQPRDTTDETGETGETGTDTAGDTPDTTTPSQSPAAAPEAPQDTAPWFDRPPDDATDYAARAELPSAWEERRMILPHDWRPVCVLVSGSLATVPAPLLDWFCADGAAHEHGLVVASASVAPVELRTAARYGTFLVGESLHRDAELRTAFEVGAGVRLPPAAGAEDTDACLVRCAGPGAARSARLVLWPRTAIGREG
ncbi:hypothetical protein [Streptomyces sp. NEAU-NA10]|uniref:hypothetical protein n=1 Tax=Streptomyces sp. NEAU-NA10 TaxID=3416050 RepID=UPI003CC6B30B